MVTTTMAATVTDDDDKLSLKKHRTLELPQNLIQL